MKKMILLLLALFFFIYFSPLAKAEWWNTNWHYKLPINISFASEAENASVNVTLNFTALLEQVGDDDKTFDPNSIRVIEDSYEHPHDWENETLTRGNVSWIANGTTPANTNRTFYVYFDVIENGAKSEGKIISEEPYWRSGYEDNIDVWSNQSTSPGIGYEWNRTWAQSLETYWKWCTEAPIYDYAYLYVDGSEVSQKYGTGSETILFQGNGLAARFTSDDSVIESCTDGYGTYGTAVDWVKFYETANYTTPAFSEFFGNTQTQYPPVLENFIVSPSLDGWGEYFNYTVDVSDRENDEVNVTLWVNKSTGWEKQETKTITPPGELYWYISIFSCSDIGARQYKFEYKDWAHDWENTSTQTGPTLENDDISLEYLTGNDTSVNREGNYNVTLGIRFKDLDKNQWVSGETVNFWVFYSSTWNQVGSNTSDTDGNTTFDFDPNCSVEVGNHNWKANYSNTCYKSNESDTFSFDVIGQLKNYLEKPLQDSVYWQGDQIPLEANVTDECTNFIIGAVVNFTLNETVDVCSADDKGDGTYNCTWDSSGKPLGNYSVRVNSSKSNYNFNSTLWEDRFSLETAPPSITINLSKYQIEQLDSLQINATVIDNSGTGIQWVKINVTRPGGTLDQNDMANIVSNIWSIDYPNSWGNTSERGTYNITVYAKDNVPKTGTSNDTFKVYIKLNVTLKTQEAIYYQGDTGRLEYTLKDMDNNSVANSNVTFEIKNPNQVLIWNDDNIISVTNQNGTIEPLPSFELASDDPIGQYRLYSFTSYWDTLAGVTVSKENNYTFNVSEKPVVEMLALSLEAPAEAAVGKKLQVSATVTDSVKNIDVDSAKTSLYDPLNNLIVDNVAMDHVSTGIYSRNYTTSSSSTQGNWKWIVNVTKGSNSIIKEIFTRLVGGPFDVRNITIIDNTIPDLSISVIIENKGDAGQDVTVEWNLTRTDTGKSLDSGAATIYIEGVSTKVHIVQPSINYLGEVKITFLVYYSGTEKAGAYETFTTTEAAPPPPSYVPPAVAPLVSKMEITIHPEEIEIERGWLDYMTVKVNNTGGTTLHDVYITLEDIPLDWVEISPEKVDLIIPTNFSEFSIKIAVPINAKSGNYLTKVKAIANETSAEESFIVRVFASRAELILYQIQTLKDKLEDLEQRTAEAENQKKNVTLVKSILTEARDRITSAEDYLDQKKYDEATNLVRNVRDLLARAEYELKVAKVIVAVPIIELLPYWLLLITIILIVIVVLILYMLRKTKTFGKLRVAVPEIRKMVLGKETLVDLRKEKEKINKMLSLLEKEYRQGIISKESYEELKKTNEEKLRGIEFKLGEER